MNKKEPAIECKTCGVEIRVVWNVWHIGIPERLVCANCKSIYRSDKPDRTKREKLVYLLLDWSLFIVYFFAIFYRHLIDQTLGKNSAQYLLFTLGAILVLLFLYSRRESYKKYKDAIIPTYRLVPSADPRLTEPTWMTRQDRVLVPIIIVVAFGFIAALFAVVY